MHDRGVCEEPAKPGSIDLQRLLVGVSLGEERELIELIDGVSDPLEYLSGRHSASKTFSVIRE